MDVARACCCCCQNSYHCNTTEVHVAPPCRSTRERDKRYTTHSTVSIRWSGCQLRTLYELFESEEGYLSEQFRIQILSTLCCPKGRQGPRGLVFANSDSDKFLPGVDNGFSCYHQTTGGFWGTWAWNCHIDSFVWWVQTYKRTNRWTYKPPPQCRTPQNVQTTGRTEWLSHRLTEFRISRTDATWWAFRRCSLHSYRMNGLSVECSEFYVFTSTRFPSLYFTKVHRCPRTSPLYAQDQNLTGPPWPWWGQF